ncbi:AfsA-related hotdog domain-containing protein [Allostreptomyces psammosilenae]|uniref:A-factor biosynthesis hotdog domain-containing protein n=1 Tax=Allostreptomyces psammosilenae TaxID=1892865 RepID=A0A853A1L2_9ACTN|nr:AfsA-related hotdog domain-containing protein [Allostreptomyces psammosilenae]NYI08259.1 hypothetical protein [Allostreptomyces psammosilenae]
MSDQHVHTICLVGDTFAGFADDETVYTVTAFVSAVRRGRFDDPRPLILWAGQGLDDYTCGYVTNVLRTRGIADRVIIQDAGLRPVPRHEAHKHREENVLVADLRRLTAEEYQARLRLHGNNELLVDHQTGQHVQGMVVVEAARQMFLAVTERYHASARPGTDWYYVINRMDVAFESFLFPIDAGIEYTETSRDLTRDDRMDFTARVRIVQAGRRAATAQIGFSAFDSAALAPKERRQARRALAATLTGRDAETARHGRLAAAPAGRA